MLVNVGFDAPASPHFTDALDAMASLLGSATSQCRVPTLHALPRQPANSNAAGRALPRRSLAIRSSVDDSVNDSVNGKCSKNLSQEHSPAAAAAETGAAAAAGVSRRSVLLAPAATAAAAVALSLGIAATAAPESAQAFGLSGPKEWLKAQKRKSMQFLLNPLMVSSAHLAAAKAEFEASTTPSELASVQAGVREASLDCLAPGFTPGVELCTFKLILKNAASLLDKNDPALVLGEEALLDLIWSYRQLHGLLDEAQGSDPPPREYIMDAFSNVQTASKFFQSTIETIFDTPV
ncbi:unnamed protein product [Closterium sp. Yama58-4]|nr:unnamed protein product [Closterium sp. Yama58-4]